MFIKHSLEGKVALGLMNDMIVIELDESKNWSWMKGLLFNLRWRKSLSPKGNMF